VRVRNNWTCGEVCCVICFFFYFSHLRLLSSKYC
jgi:hypothetical protein